MIIEEESELQKQREALSSQAFQQTWDNPESTSQDIQAFFNVPWWSVKWKKKGTLLHRAASHQKQQKIHWLREVLTDVATYKKRWTHENVRRGLLEVLLRSGAQVEAIKEWMHMGILWGAPTSMHEQAFHEWLDYPNGGCHVPLEQLKALGKLTEEMGHDAWGLDTQRNGVSRVMSAMRMKDVQENPDACVDFLPKKAVIPNALLSDLCQRGKHDLVMRVLRRSFQESSLEDLMQKEGESWISCMLKSGRWHAACELAEWGCTWPEGSAHEAFAKHGIPFIPARKMGDKINWLKTQLWFTAETPKGKTPWLEAALKHNKTAVAFRLTRDLGVSPVEVGGDGRPVGLTLTESRKQYWFENRSVFGGQLATPTHQKWVADFLSVKDLVSEEEWSEMMVRSVNVGRWDLIHAVLESDVDLEYDWERTWRCRDTSWKSLVESETMALQNREVMVKKLKEMLENKGLKKRAMHDKPLLGIKRKQAL
jgi:hypothetical protein